MLEFKKALLNKINKKGSVNIHNAKKLTVFHGGGLH
jgi:hypothetical protein